MTTTDININSASHRLTQRPPIFTCDLCEKAAATHRVHRIEGARVITATVCGACKQTWEGK